MPLTRIPPALPWSCVLALAAAAEAASPDDASTLQRGRYMVATGQCNNCHTDGYSASGGTVPIERWLTGNSRHWQTREGTVYATNLRLLVHEISEEAWVQLCRHGRPRAPMPWWSLRDTSEEDLRAMYRFIRSLGPAGERARPFEPADPSRPRPPGPAAD